MTDAIQALEAAYSKNRGRLLCDDGSIRTPLVVLREVAKEYGTPLHMECHEIHVSPSCVIHQIEMYTGRIRGRGEAPRRRLALQIAAFDLLLKVESGGFEVPLYGMVPGGRINPSIFGDLLELCSVLNLCAPMYIQLAIDPEEEMTELFMFKCQVGQLIRIGKSDSRYIAQRIAAKMVFEALTETEVELDKVSMGASCHALQNFKIKPGTSQKKMDIMKFRMESRMEEEAAAGSEAQLGFEEDDFGDSMESVPRKGRATSPDVSERLGKLNLNEARKRGKVLTMIQEEDENM